MITAILQALDLSRATYYRWYSKGTKETLTEVEQAIMSICKAVNYRYGHRKVKALLKEDYNIKCNRNTVLTLFNVISKRRNQTKNG
ncbi:transposase [Halobacillus sp. A5]|uniref:transposase n=1 Tax=Halobacillus sp. A5 TaxID=2880263 RepID=UPI003531EBE1|nr:IS3 family transposase [Halobacillus sp. A5]